MAEQILPDDLRYVYSPEELAEITELADTTIIEVTTPSTAIPLKTTVAELKEFILSGGTGSGDMLASTYDPTNVAGDAFDMDNMVEGDTNKLVSSTEKSNWDAKLDFLQVVFSYSGETLTSTKTVAEILAAITANKQIIAYYAGIAGFITENITVVPDLVSFTFLYDSTTITITGDGSGETDSWTLLEENIEKTSNKVSTWAVTPNDTNYPTEKLVKDGLDDKQDALTFGIANTNVPKIDDSSAADNEYVKFTANGLEGRTYAEVLSDIGGQAALGFTPENVANKVTEFQVTPDDTHYASEKLVYDQLQLKANLLNNTWIAAILPSSAYWSSVCYGNGRYVAVAYYSNKAAYSTDGGETWIAATLPSSAYWSSVCYGNGRYVAVAYDSNKAAYSTDGGETWIAATLPSSAYWSSVCYGNGRYVAVDRGDYSSDKAAYLEIKKVADFDNQRINYDAKDIFFDKTVSNLETDNTQGAIDELAAKKESVYLQCACSDKTTPLAVGTGVGVIPVPCSFVLTEVRAFLVTAQTSGNLFTIDVKLDGTSILSTFLTIDNGEHSSTSATTPAVISTQQIADDSVITVDVTQIGDGTAIELIVTLKGHKL